MKLTIDTKEKTIEAQGDVSFAEFMQEVSNLKDMFMYTLIHNGTKMTPTFTKTKDTDFVKEFLNQTP